MTESWCYIDGQKVMIPLAPYQAREFGWHLGTEFLSTYKNFNPIDDEIYEWCKQTFDPYVYKVFIRSVWFWREQDAVVCRLKWS